MAARGAGVVETSRNVRQEHAEEHRGRSPLIELIGPAGAGKSALLQALAAREPRIRRTPGVWGPGHLALAASTVRTARLLLTLRGGSAFDREALKYIVRLDALATAMEGIRLPEGQVLCIDEGPLFALACFDVRPPSFVASPVFRRWRTAALDHWSRALDVVIVLDAPDSVLVRRIRERAKAHRVKFAPDREITAFLATARRAFAKVLAELPTASRPLVLRLDAEGGTPDELAEQVLLALRPDALASAPV